MALRAQNPKTSQPMENVGIFGYGTGPFSSLEGWGALLSDDSLSQEDTFAAYPYSLDELEMFFNYDPQLNMTFKSQQNFSCDADIPIEQEIVIYNGPSSVSSDQNDELYSSSADQSPQEAIHVDDFDYSSWLNESSQKENAFFSYGGEQMGTGGMSGPPQSPTDASLMFPLNQNVSSSLDDSTVETIKEFLMNYADQQFQHFADYPEESLLMPPPLHLTDVVELQLTTPVREESPSVSSIAASVESVPMIVPTKKGGRKKKALVASSSSTISKKKASVASSTSASYTSKKRSGGRKVSEKKRGQNKNAAARYRSKKRIQEDVAMEQHQRLLTELEELKATQVDLRKNIAFVVRLAEEKIKKMKK